MKKTVKTIMITLFMISLLAACSNNTVDETLIIGYDNTFVPMGFLDEAGETVGFDIDLATEVFQRLEVDFLFQPIDWSMKEAELNNGNIDLLWNGYTLTEERQKLVSYTDAYLENSQVMVTLHDSQIVTKADLVDKTIATQQGSSSLTAIERDALLNEVSLNLYDTFDQAFRDLEIGRIDALVVDEILAFYYINQRDANQYQILEEVLEEEIFVVAFRKDDTDLRDLVNEALNELKADGTFDTYYEKWFSH